MEYGVFEERYKRLRNGWWVGLSVLWLGFWYWKLSTAHQAVAQSLVDCQWYDISCGASDLASNLNFYFGMFFAILATLLLVIPARYVARWTVEGEMKQAADGEARRQSAAQAEEARLHTERMAASEATATQSRASIHRSEFIQKLGMVSDLARLLADEDDRNEIKQIKTSIAQAMRDLTAKHTLADLAGFIRSDPAIRISLPGVLSTLGEAGLASAPEVAVLREAVAVAAQSTR